MTRVLPTTAVRFVYSGGGRLSFACVCHEHSQCCFIARRNAVDPKWCYLSVCVAVTYVGQQLCHCVWAASGGVFLHCLAYSVVQDVASRPRFSRRGYAVSVYARVGNDADQQREEENPTTSHCGLLASALPHCYGYEPIAR